MKLLLHPQYRSLLAGLLALCLALAAFAGLALPAGAASSRAPSQTGATSSSCTLQTDLLTNSQCKGVAIAQIATVRIVADYHLITLPGTPSGTEVRGAPQTGPTKTPTSPPTSTPTPTPTKTPTPPVTTDFYCTGLGVLVQSATNAQQNAGSTYLLTTNAILAANEPPCLNNATITMILSSFPGATLPLMQATIYLNTAYTNASTAPISFQFQSKDADPTRPLPNVSAQATTVLVPLTPRTGVQAHDYPTIGLATSSTATQMIDLLDSTGTGPADNQLTGDGSSGTQYLTPKAQTAPAGAAISKLSPGAPLIDAAGALVSLGGLSNGLGITTQDLDRLPNATSSCPGPTTGQPNTTCLSYRWQQAMQHYYPMTAGKDETQAKAAIQQIANQYTDFGGAKAFAGAITLPTNGPSGGFKLDLNSPVTIALLVLVVLLLLVFIMTLLITVRRLRRRSERAQAAQGGPFPMRSRASGQLEPGYVLPPGANAATPYPPPMPNGPARRTIICQRCGAQNMPGASTCANCGIDLPQGLAGTSGVGRGLGRSTSGGPLPLSLPPLNPPPAPSAADIAEMSTLINYQSPGQSSGASNPELERTLPTMPAVGARQQDDATVVIRGRQRPPLGIKVSTKSDVGRRRAGKANEDNFLAVTGTWKHNGQLQPFGVFVIADGMGGHANGQDASRMAVETIYQHLNENLPQQDLPDEALGEFLQQAIQRANQMIYHQNQKDHADMGCTMTAALITGNEAHICNVGDSRTYLLTPSDHLQRVTTDHSIVQSLVDAGVIQKDDVYTHPKRNQIYRSLGEKEAQEIDIFRQRLGPNDKLLLCCDGLWEMIRDPEIEQTMRQDDLPQVTNKLIEMANENGGVDNITAIVVKVTEEAKPAKQPMIQSVASGPANLDHSRQQL